MGSAASRGSDATASAGSDLSLSPAPSPAPLHLPANKLNRQFTAPAAVVHHPPQRRGDSNHLVSLTSTTYGSLLLLDQGDRRLDQVAEEELPPPPTPSSLPPTTTTGAVKKEFQTPTAVINAWELMDGLDDPTPPPSKTPGFGTDRPYASRKPESEPPRYRRRLSPLQQSPKPLWKHLSVESLLDDMDPSVSSSLHRSLTMPAPSSRPSPAPTLPRVFPSTPSPKFSRSPLPADRVVIYTTSLRGVRRTYEDCCSVRSLLRAHRVAVDERDVSMDAAYRTELQGLLGRKPPSLPQVFIGGKWAGGAEEVRQMNETGELRKLLDKAALAVAEPWAVCGGCGGARFAPCGECSGSRKVFDEGLGVVRRCPLCNENGLVRCPVCC